MPRYATDYELAQEVPGLLDRVEALEAENEKLKANPPGLACEESGYDILRNTLQAALDQAARGKGKERHANSLPFEKQPILEIARKEGLAFLRGQVQKKFDEAKGMYERDQVDAMKRELLGMINYVAAVIIFVDEEIAPPR